MESKKYVDFGLLLRLAEEVPSVRFSEEDRGPFFSYVITMLAMDDVPMSPAVEELGRVLDVLL